MKRILITTAAIAATSTAAFAGNIAEPAPEPVVQQPAPQAVEATPTYDFSGFSAGAQLGYGDIQADGDGADLDGDGTLYGLRMNYDRDFGNFVLGGGVNYDGGEIELDDGPAVDGILRAGPRAGYNFGRSMVYATGGYAKAYTDDDDLGDSNGYYVGIGSETFLTENITAGGEINYHEFDDFDAEGIDADATTASLNINYRF